MTMNQDPQSPSNLKIHCDNASSLVQSYLDGELTEAQAAPLREHLLDCPGCREMAKSGRVLRRWFEGAPHEMGTVHAPDGFASRVARRAFAGDPGLLIPAPRRELLPFLLVVTTVAAAALLVFSIALQRQTIPTSGTMSADDYRAPWEDRVAEDRWAIDEGAQPAYAVPTEALPKMEGEQADDGEEAPTPASPTKYEEPETD